MKKIEFDYWLLTILCGIILLPSTQVFAQTLAPAASNGKLAFHSFRTGNFEVFTISADFAVKDLKQQSFTAKFSFSR